MVEQGNGRIIFVSSIIGEIGNIGQSNCKFFKIDDLEKGSDSSEPSLFLSFS